MKIYCGADFHFNDRGEKIEYADTIIGKDYLQSLENTEQIFQDCIKNEVPGERNILLSGDIIDKKHIVDTSIILFHQLLDRYTNDIDKVIILCGNHDIVDHSDHSVSYLPAFKSIKNVTIIDYNEYIIEDNMVFLAFSNNFNDKFSDIINELDHDKQYILFSHFAVSEALLSNGISIKTKITFKDLSEAFRLIILGDYHKPQKLENDHSTLYYCGSTYQKTWGEMGEEKRYLIVDTKNYSVKSVDYKHYYKHIELEAIDDNISLYQKYESEGHYVRFITNDSKKHNELIKHGFKCKYVAEKEKTEKLIQKMDEKKDPYASWLEIKEVPKEKHEVYLKIKKEILENAK